jgi:hypothetical protein
MEGPRKPDYPSIFSCVVSIGWQALMKPSAHLLDRNECCGLDWSGSG